MCANGCVVVSVTCAVYTCIMTDVYTKKKKKNRNVIQNGGLD